MIRVKKLYGIFIIENRTRFIERNAMLLDINFFLTFIPFKLQFIHMYIVFIISRMSMCKFLVNCYI
jgi:hypothetical protein